MGNGTAVGPMLNGEMKHITPQGRGRHGYSAVGGGTNLSHKAGKVKRLDSTLSRGAVNMKQALKLSKKIREGGVIIGKTNSKVSMRRTIDLLKDLINKRGYFCIYVTFRRPFATLLKEFNKRGVETGQMYFFDAVTRLSMDVDGNGNCSFVDSPQQLTYLLVFIKRELDLIEGRKAFLILDTLTNVLDHNSRRETIHFVHALTNKLRLINIGGNFMVPRTAARDNVAYHDFIKFVDSSIAI